MSDKPTPTFCSVCGRTLRDRKSVELRIGPECADKQQAFVAGCGSSLEEIASLALLDDPTVTRWVGKFAGALRIGRIRDGKAFIEAARRAADRSRMTGNILSFEERIAPEFLALNAGKAA